MVKMNIAAVIAIAALLLGTVGCSETATNTNTNTNRVANANANTAVVVNNNNNAVARADDDDWDPDITRGDFDKDRGNYERRAKESGSTVGQGADDLWIWTKTRASLLGADDLRDSTINVDVENNVVTLKGTVANAAQKTKAEQTAKQIEGVKSVRNQLTVSATGDTNGNRNANANGNRRS